MHVYTSKSFRNEHRHRKQVFHNSGMWTNCVYFLQVRIARFIHSRSQISQLSQSLHELWMIRMIYWSIF
uniref:Uncharacterized protein n=1 Tax=Meloidogyne incognita TaxID=6306 RepID=A0A914NEK9_MELIC